MLRLLSGMVDRYLGLRQPLTAQLESWQRNLLNPRRPFKDWTTLLEARTAWVGVVTADGTGGTTRAGRHRSPRGHQPARSG